MASQDVIELGSSDDEPEPAPKRSKPPLNAMVHIPSNLPGVVIKKTKPKNRNGQAPKPLQGLTKVLPSLNSFQPVSIPVVTKTNINPLSLMKSMSNSQIQIKKLPASNTTQAVALKRTGNPSPRPQGHVLKRPLHIGPKGLASNLLQATKIIKNIFNSNTTNLVPQSSKSISKLPPGITIKAVKSINNSMAGPKRQINRPPLPAAKKKKINTTNTTNEVLTVELDDDDSPKSNDSPQWYMKPEDQTPDTSLEAANNKEPDTQNFIEITIEDSPIKPLLDKKTKELTKDAINIDESPAKPLENEAHNQEEDSGSDNETEHPRKTPNSKKRLQYSKQINDNTSEASACLDDVQFPHTIEIEIPPLVEPTTTAQISKETVIEPVVNDDAVIEILESPAKKKRKVTTIKNLNIPVTNKVIEPLIRNDLADSENSLFHPIYQSFIDLCFKLENSEDMKKIVEKKIKTYYLQVPKEYTESEEFLEMVSSKIMSMKAGPEKMYLYIKDIVDELNLQRKMAKSQAIENEKKQEKEASEFYGEELEADTKRRRQVRKLEKTLKKLNRAIHKLEEQEVDFDDDGDSVYLLTESEDEIDTTSGKDNDKPAMDKDMLLQRYKERLVRVHAKLCQLSNTKMPSEPRLHVEPRPGRPAGPARRLEKFINKRVPVGTPLPFPDFHDVLRFVREANDEDKLGWNEVDIMEEARDLFTRCGKKLQRRRQENEWRVAASRVPPADVDPAEGSDELRRKLEDNRRLSALKEAELINKEELEEKRRLPPLKEDELIKKYADRQKQLHLEAEEIGDKEAEESPVESGDEALEEQRQEEEALESTEGRKERLKRLIKEKSKVAIKNANPIELDDDEKDNTNHEKTDNEEGDVLEKGEENVDDSMKSDVEKIRKNEAGSSNANDNTELNSPKAIRSGSNDDVHLLSDDSKDVGSEGDEMNLLRKLHSGTEVATSTLDSSDTDTPIAISDTLGSTLESSDDVQKKESKHSSDIVSIENSSYSESEVVIKEQDIEHPNSEEEVIAEVADIQRDDPLQMNIDGNKESPKKNRDSNDEYTERVEDILLASSDDEEKKQSKEPEELSIDGEDNDDSFINLKDDSISIGDTVIEGSTDTNSASNVNITAPETADIDNVVVKTGDHGSDKVIYESESTSDYAVQELVPIEDVIGKVSRKSKKCEEPGQECMEFNDNNTFEEADEPNNSSTVKQSTESQDDVTVTASLEDETVMNQSNEPMDVTVIKAAGESQNETETEPIMSSDNLSENIDMESEPMILAVVDKIDDTKHEVEIAASGKPKCSEESESSKPNNDKTTEISNDAIAVESENIGQQLNDSPDINKGDSLDTEVNSQLDQRMLLENKDLLEKDAINKVPISIDDKTNTKEICVNNCESESVDTS